MSSDERTGYCKTKKCELYNQYQGDCGLERDEKFTCAFCKKNMSKVRL